LDKSPSCEEHDDSRGVREGVTESFAACQYGMTSCRDINVYINITSLLSQLL